VAIYRHIPFDESSTDLDHIFHAGGNIMPEDPRFPEQAFDCTPVVITRSSTLGKEGEPITLCAYDCWDVSEFSIGLRVGKSQVAIVPARELIQAIALSAGMQVVYHKDGVHLMRRTGVDGQPYTLQDAADLERESREQVAKQDELDLSIQDELVKAAMELGIDLAGPPPTAADQAREDGSGQPSQPPE
jgi:hypothetical protein